MEGLAEVEQVQDGIAIVAHHHQGAMGQPAAQQQDHLASPVGEFLVPASLPLVIAFRWRQRGEQGQGPEPSRPGDASQPHQTDPAQPAGLDRIAAAGTHGVSVDTQSVDLWTLPTLQGFVDTEHQRTVAVVEMLKQQPEQDLGRPKGRPRRPVQHVMVAGIVAVAAEAHDPQRPRPLCAGPASGSRRPIGPEPFARFGFGTAWRREREQLQWHRAG